MHYSMLKPLYLDEIHRDNSSKSDDNSPSLLSGEPSGRRVYGKSRGKSRCLSPGIRG